MVPAIFGIGLAARYGRERCPGSLAELLCALSAYPTDWSAHLGDGSDPDHADRTGRQDFSDVRQRLDALEDKLEARRPDPVDEHAAKVERSNYAMAIRVSSDFIAAIFVGGALGWFLDSMAGTTPFGLVILLLLGFAAGVLNVMRTLGLVATPKGAPSSAAARRHDTEENGREGS